MLPTCVHCGREVERHANDKGWFHVWRSPDGLIYGGGLNRCQSSEVPYGHNAHAKMPCPGECMGSWSEGGNCSHVSAPEGTPHE